MKKIITLIALAFTINANAQNVGIGTTNPNYKLQVNSAGYGIIHSDLSNNVQVGTYVSSIGGWLGTRSKHNLHFYTNNSNPLFTLDTLGRMGIGTQTPNYLLDVNGRARLRHIGATSGMWYNKADNTESAFIGMVNDTTYGFWGIGTVGNWKMGFDVKNAQMGIGLTDPTAPLSFASNIGNKIALWGNATGGHYGLGIQGSLMQMYSSTSNDDIAFGYGSSNAFTENMRVKGNGNVGIGTNNPTASIEVARGTAAGGTAQFNGTTYTSHINYSTTEDTYLRGGKTASKVFINDQANGNVLLAGGGGNVGIGSPNPTSKLEVIGNNTTQTGYFGQSGSGNAITASAGSAATAISAFSTSATMPVVAITNISGASPLKIVDGNQANGKVLTSDANGNASWQRAAYNNSERFKFSLSNITSTSNALTVQYNTSTATTTFNTYDDFFLLNITKSGLYHFDLNAHQRTLSADYSQNGLYASMQYLYFSYGSYIEKYYSPFFKEGISSSYISYSSFDKSFEIQINAPVSIKFYSFKTPSIDEYKFNVTGHLISE
jgi:hypothetical protein